MLQTPEARENTKSESIILMIKVKDHRLKRAVVGDSPFIPMSLCSQNDSKTPLAEKETQQTTLNM